MSAEHSQQTPDPTFQPQVVTLSLKDYLRTCEELPAAEVLANIAPGFSPRTYGSALRHERHLREDGQPLLQLPQFYTIENRRGQAGSTFKQLSHQQPPRDLSDNPHMKGQSEVPQTHVEPPLSQREATLFLQTFQRSDRFLLTHIHPSLAEVGPPTYILDLARELRAKLKPHTLDSQQRRRSTPPTHFSSYEDHRRDEMARVVKVASAILHGTNPFELLLVEEDTQDAAEQFIDWVLKTAKLKTNLSESIDFDILQ